jgi:hypothetical protein
MLEACFEFALESAEIDRRSRETATGTGNGHPHLSFHRSLETLGDPFKRLLPV